MANVHLCLRFSDPAGTASALKNVQRENVLGKCPRGKCLGGNVGGCFGGECPREKCPRPTGDFRYGRAKEMKKMRLVDE